MANTLTPKNPQIVQNGIEVRVLERVATTGQTWKAGEFGTSVSGLVSVVASDAVDIKYYLLEDETSTAAGAKVKVVKVDASLVFEGFVAASTISAANLDVNYGINVASNIVQIDTTDTTNDCVYIVELASDYEPERHAADDIIAKCRFQILPAVINVG